MSTTSTTVLEIPRTASPAHTEAPIALCLNCGTEIPNGAGDSQQKIQELESQIKILTLRATSAGMLHQF